MSPTKCLPACLALSFASFTALASNGPPPPTVSQPSGINLGGTSFYDGFAGPPGLSHLTYLKFSSASSIRGNSGKENSAFDDPKISVVTLINQLSYYSPETIGGGAHLGWSLLVPVVSLDGDFGDKGVKLKDNATGMGDITLGPQVQFDPIVDVHGRPVFVQRLALDVILPVGKYDAHKDLNPGSNYYSINPLLGRHLDASTALGAELAPALPVQLQEQGSGQQFGADLRRAASARHPSRSIGLEQF